MVSTLGGVIGEIVWLMTQSPIHRKLQLGDLAWLLYPPVLLNQYKIFRDESGQAQGVVFWGYINEQAEIKLRNLGKLAPEDWGNNAQVDSEKGLIARDGGQLWLVEMIAPFHTAENMHRERMIEDLKKTSFGGRDFKLFKLNMGTGKREETLVSGK